MKVLVVNNMVPGLLGGAEQLADNLVLRLRQAGHQSEQLRIPFSWDPPERLIEEMLICRGMRLMNVDRVIALKFPAYLLPFDNKVFWLVHQFRQAYDLWDAGQTNIPDTPRGHEIRSAIVEADNRCFGRAKAIYSIGRAVQERLLHYNGVRSQLLRPPLNDPELFGNTGYGDYIFAGGRINAGKRQHRLVEALARTRSGAKLIIAGPADTPDDELRLRRLVEQFGLQDRVKLDIGFLPRQTIVDYVNGSLASAYLPFDEDCFGYVTTEACQARKPVITLADSGDVQLLIRNGETGYVCDDDTDEIAGLLDSVWNDRAKARDLGEAGYQTWTAMDVNWETTVERLLA